MAVSEEKRAEREARRKERDAARAQRQYERLRSHVVTCPACGAEALDHMTKCPKCGAELTPAGYKPAMDEKTKKRIRAVTYTVGAVIVVAAIVLVTVFN